MKSSFGSHLSASLTFSGFTSIFLTSTPEKKYFNISFLGKNLILFSFLVAAFTGIQAQTRHYVNQSAAGTNNGQNWQNAFKDLQTAITFAQSGDSIWIAQGTYFATATTDRTVSFEPRSGVRIFGGFSGTETEVSQRDWDTNQTILSGDIGTVGDSTDNTNNIMAFVEAEEGTILDGLTFRGGVSEGTFIYDIFQREGCGGAIYLNAEDGVGYLVMRNCRFERNYAQLKGAAVFVRASQDGSIAPQFLNCVFEYNSGNDGAAVYCNGYVDIERIPDFGDCQFTENNILTTAPLSVIRYITPSTNDTLHFSRCRFEMHAGLHPAWRVIWTKADNHIRIDSCVFNDNDITILRTDFFAPTIGGVESIHILNCEFNGNRFGLYLFTKEAVISDCVFKFNFMSLSTNSPKSIIRNCLLDSNKFGVGLFSTSGNCENCLGENLTICNNIGSGYGSQLFFIGADHGKVKYQNINIYNNDSIGLFAANQFGDSVMFTNFNVIGNTFLKNTTSQTVHGHFKNSIFYGNEFITPDYYAIFPSLTFENCSIDYPDCSYFPPTVTCINNLFNQYPQFRDTANQDYSLLPCSPLINAGSNAAAAGILTDLAGNPRILEGTVDIGAFEAPAFALAAAPAVSPACVGTEGGSITLQPVHGCEPYIYDWMPNAGTGPELNGLPPGAYQITLTDASGRQIMDTVLVPEAPQPNVSLATANVQCGNPAGGSLTAVVNNGTGPFSYQWLPAAADTSTLKNLSAGAYSLTLTDANGCQDSTSASLVLLGALTLSVDGKTIPCYGETGWLSATPLNGAAPFSWLWSGWAGADSLAQPLTPGNYAVTVSDAYGCTSSFAFPAMTQPDSLSVGTGSDPQSQSNPPNGVALVTTISGGTSPFAFDWNPMGMTQAITGLEAGTYTVTVSDKNGCTATAVVVVDFMVGTQSLDKQPLVLFPNPATDWVRVLLPAGEWYLELLDAGGRALRTRTCGGEDCVFDLEGLSAGGYLLRAWNGEQVWIGRAVKR